MYYRVMINDPAKMGMGVFSRVGILLGDYSAGRRSYSLDDN